MTKDPDMTKTLATFLIFCASLAQAQLLESLLYGPENVEDADKKTIHFSSLELSLWSGLKNMTLIGTFNVVELSKTKLVLKQTVLNTSTIYSFTRTAKSE